MCIYNLTLEHTLKELCSYVCQKICIRMFIIALFEMLETKGKNVHLHGQYSDCMNRGLFNQWTMTQQ